jgi:HSP20 family protein
MNYLEEEVMRELKRLSEKSLEVIPAIRITDQESKYEIIAEIPGVLKKDVDLTYEKDVLTLSTNLQEIKGEKEAVYNELKPIRYKRTIPLNGVDIKKTAATLKNGMLMISLPKLENHKAQKITVN